MKPGTALVTEPQKHTRKPGRAEAARRAQPCYTLTSCNTGGRRADDGTEWKIGTDRVGVKKFSSRDRW